MKKNRFQLMMPINIVSILQIATLILFFWGPIKHTLNTPILDFVYLVTLFISVRMGYCYGIKKYESSIFFQSSEKRKGNLKHENFSS